MKVLLTYFEPFGPYKVNVTKECTKIIKHILKNAGIRVKRLELKVEPHELFKKLNRHNLDKYDYILMFGQTHTHNALEIEGHSTWYDDGKTYNPDICREKKLKITLKDTDAWQNNTGFKLDKTIGNYSCSLSYYISLCLTNKNEDTRVGFFHVNEKIGDKEKQTLASGIRDSILNKFSLQFWQTSF